MHTKARQTASLAPDVDRNQLRHHAAGHEDSRWLAQQLGNLGLEAFDQRTAAIVIMGHSVGLCPIRQFLEPLGGCRFCKPTDLNSTSRPELAAFFINVWYHGRWPAQVENRSWNVRIP